MQKLISILTHLSFPIQDDIFANAFIATPIVGYEGKMDRFRLGIEGQAFWTPIEFHSVDRHGTHIDQFLHHEYVILLRPGYQLFDEAPFVLYANIGAVYAQIETKADPNGIQAISIGDQNVWGYKVGAGVAYEFSQHWIARADYIFSQYQEITNSAPQNFDVRVIVPVRYELNSSQSQYLLGITYQW